MNDLARWFEDNEEWRKFPDLIVVPPTVDETEEKYPEVDASEFFTDDGQPYLMRGSDRITAIAHYYKMRQSKQKHAFAVMCAQERGPKLMTDAVFAEGNTRLGDNYHGSYGDALKATAKKHGFTSSYQYHPGLARWHPEDPKHNGADPEAYMPPSGGRGYVKRLMESRGWACDGAVDVEGRAEKDPFDDAVSLAPELIVRNAQKFVQENPDEARKMNRRELRDHMVANHGVN